MVDEFRSIKDNLLKSVFSAVASVSEKTDGTGNQNNRSPAGAIREIISSLAGIAGKGKDEIVQMISREIGQAVAGVVKEPLIRILEDRKIKISIELVAKDKNENKNDASSKNKKSNKNV